MHIKSLSTLLVLLAALWGGFCLFNTRPIFVSRHSVCEDKHIVSSIADTNAIIDVLNYTSLPRTLVVFDIDNTLAAPKGDLGTDQYSYYLIEQRLKEGLSFEQALASELPKIFEIDEHLNIFPLEKETLHVLDYLRSHNIPVIALTARSVQIAKRTITQLADAGIVLQAPTSFNREFSFALEVPALYKDNIVFCARNDKGKVLMHLLKQFNYAPECIVYVDDKLSHVLSLEKECLANHIRFVGIRYGFCDERVKNFDPARAQQELDLLMKNMNGKPAATN